MKTLKNQTLKIKRFFEEAYVEFKKVAWPSKDKTIRLTGYVLGVSLGVALYVWGLDLLLKEALSAILVK